MSISIDRHNLQRFVDAQQGMYDRALGELRRGRKESHWMWFIFPQLQGLGHSAMARKFAISGVEEAAAYLAHPLLGPRLRECTAAVNALRGQPIEDVFGYPDYMKFQSSMTLFAKAARDSEIFVNALKHHFHSAMDPKTVERL